MTKKLAVVCLLAAACVTSLQAQEGSVPKGVKHLDHVFIVMMENHGYHQIISNPNAPFINQLATTANLATNYFAIGHPSLTNYLEIIGGSNFGVRSDDAPNWHSACLSNLLTGMTTFDNPASDPALICPIDGTGPDAATPAIDCTNEVQIPPAQQPAGCYWDIDGTLSIAANPKTVGKMIGDQLDEHGMSWKSYQEDLPIGGADGVNISDGVFSNLTDFTPFLSPTSFSSWSIQGVTIPAAQSQANAQGDIVNLYAVKHNPFAYFKIVQQGDDPDNSLKNVAGFEGPTGLYSDLASGNVPNLSFIAPNQCNDHHGQSNAGPFCNFDVNDNGTQSGLNETEILRGDIAVQQIVTSITASPAWRQGNNAIVVVWDENDYTATLNQVATIVVTNHGPAGVQSSNFYSHFSLLRTMEGGFGLPCLNHACDSNVQVMSDLFGKESHF